MLHRAPSIDRAIDTNQPAALLRARSIWCLFGRSSVLGV